MEALKEFLFPSGSFRGPDPAVNARNTGKARCIMLVFYLGCLALFLYHLYVYFLTGRVEVVTTTYKMDWVEAPSVAVCPFWPDTSIKLRSTPRGRLLHVVKYGAEGPEHLEVQAYTCTFDRVCICGDLWEFGSDESSRVAFRDHRSRRVGNIGTTGAVSEAKLKFRERIEVKTRATDSSGDETLKVGFYDSVDRRPQWFYMHQGAYVLGTLELATWTVSHGTFEAMYHFLTGEWGALIETRHLFRYTSQEVAQGLWGEKWPESTFSYEMKDFFIENTVSSETSMSFYTLAYLLFIFVIRHAVVNIFVGFMFPEHQEHAGEAKQRDMSHQAEVFAEMICWSSFTKCFERLESSETPPSAPGETSRLLPSADVEDGDGTSSSAPEWRRAWG
jgi:hypothetical protein